MRNEPMLIAGMGVVSAAGVGTRATLAAFEAGERNPGPATLFETAIACPVFEVRGHPPGPPDSEMRTVSLVRAAADEALRDAGFTPDNLVARRVGICLGTTVACQLNDLAFYTALRAGSDPSLEPVERYLKSSLAEALARRLRVRGPTATVANACSSGTDAIGVALAWLRAGLCDVAIAGGADELSRIPLCGFHSLSVMSPEPCRPFDRDRKGLNLGEGAGVLVLETRACARRRGRTSDLVVAGYGAAGDAYHMTAPRPDGTGLETAIRSALSEAGATPGDVAFVNAHGTATPDNDRTEGAVLARVFGPGLRFLSTKGYTGHTLGAAGGMEAVFTALGLRECWLPPSAGFSEADPEIPAAPLAARTAVDGPCALSTSLAFGGSNSAVVIAHAGKEPA